MNKKIKTDKGILFIFATVYTILGSVFLLMGIIFNLSLKKEKDGFIVGIVFSSIGLLFLIVGVILQYINYRKNKKLRQLVENGRYITGNIVEYIPNFNVRINGRHPIIVKARYEDLNGVVHIFKSRNVYQYVGNEVMNKPVKIYVEDNEYKNYYMDVDEILSCVIEH